MEIRKEKNRENCYDIFLKEDNKELRFMYGGNLDLYISLGDGRLVPENEKTSIYFDITKENIELFSIFDKLYDDVISGNVFEKEEEENCFKFKNSFEYHKLVDEDNNITWISDDGPEELVDRFKISKYDDTYRLTFTRTDKELDCGFKSFSCISVRIRNSGSRYNYFHCPFMFMFQRLQNLDLENQKKLEKKRNSTKC